MMTALAIVVAIINGYNLGINAMFAVMGAHPYTKRHIAVVLVLGVVCMAFPVLYLLGVR